jgi:hypothetical protein
VRADRCTDLGGGDARTGPEAVQEQNQPGRAPHPGGDGAGGSRGAAGGGGRCARACTRRWRLGRSRARRVSAKCELSRTPEHSRAPTHGGGVQGSWARSPSFAVGRIGRSTALAGARRRGLRVVTARRGPPPPTSTKRPAEPPERSFGFFGGSATEDTIPALQEHGGRDPSVHAKPSPRPCAYSDAHAAERQWLALRSCCDWERAWEGRCQAARAGNDRPLAPHPRIAGWRP